MEKQLPSRRWFLLPAVLLLLSLLLWIWAGASVVGLLRQEAVLLDAVGDTRVAVTKGGRYEIYCESRSLFVPVREMRFSFTRADGEVVQSRPPFGTSRYNIGGKKGWLVGVVRLDQGDYTARGDGGDSQLTFVLRQGSLGGWIVRLTLSVIGGTGLLLTGATSLIILLVHRASLRKKMNR